MTARELSNAHGGPVSWAVRLRESYGEEDAATVNLRASLTPEAFEPVTAQTAFAALRIAAQRFPVELRDRVDVEHMEAAEKRAAADLGAGTVSLTSKHPGPSQHPGIAIGHLWRNEHTDRVWRIVDVYAAGVIDIVLRDHEHTSKKRGARKRNVYREHLLANFVHVGEELPVDPPAPSVASSEPVDVDVTIGETTTRGKLHVAPDLRAKLEAIAETDMGGDHTFTVGDVYRNRDSNRLWRIEAIEPHEGEFRARLVSALDDGSPLSWTGTGSAVLRNFEHITERDPKPSNGSVAREDYGAKVRELQDKFAALLPKDAPTNAEALLRPGPATSAILAAVTPGVLSGAWPLDPKTLAPLCAELAKAAPLGRLHPVVSALERGDLALALLLLLAYHVDTSALLAKLGRAPA